MGFETFSAFPRKSAADISAGGAKGHLLLCMQCSFDQDLLSSASAASSGVSVSGLLS